MIDKKERYLIDTVIRNGMTVFDVGVNKGEWIGLVLAKYKDITAHVFDPILGILGDVLPGPEYSLYKNVVAVSDCTGEKEFYTYEKITELSTLYRRSAAVEKQFDLDPKITKVKTTTLDDYCSKHNIAKIDFLKIDVEGAELDVFRGAQTLFRGKRIAHLQFEYGGCNLDSKVALLDLYFYLRSVGYDMYTITETGRIKMENFDTKLEDYQLTNYYAQPEEKNTLEW